MLAAGRPEEIARLFFTPTHLAAHGDADEITPSQHSETLQHLIPDAGRVVLPGMRHGYFAEIALAFLAQHPLADLAAGPLD